MEERVYLAALNKCFHGNWNTAHRLLEHFGSARAVFETDRKTLDRLLPGMEASVENIAARTVLDEAAGQMAFCRKEGVEVITIADESYPARLAETPDAPLVLFKRGCRKLNGSKFLAIVGTRHCSAHSKRYCDMMAEYLSSLTVKPVIVSGMAYGIDTWAHQSALRYGLDTVAVTATGSDTVYPASNRQLATMIEERGAVVTEYWAQTPGYPSNFICRNRIIAGLCDATVVVESRLRGGSLITARAAFNYDREVFAFPGRIEDLNFEGCDMLIAENIARLIRGAEDICREMDWLPGEGKGTGGKRDALPAGLSPQKRTILQVMRGCGGMDAAQIASSCGCDVSQVSYLLLEMEIEGHVRHISANKYVSLR